MIHYGRKGRSLKLIHPRGNHCDLLQLALQTVTLNHLLPQMHELTLDISAPSNKFLLRNPCYFRQIFNSEIQEVIGENLKCIVNSAFDDPLTQVSMTSDLTSIQPDLFPQALQILSFPEVSNLYQDITVLDAHSSNVVVALKEEGQFKILSIDEKSMCILLDVSLNFLYADGKGVSLIVPEELD